MVRAIIGLSIITPSFDSFPIIEDPHPYPSPLEGEGQRERGLHDRGALEKGIFG
jgi:hypothetical protein